MPTFHDSVDDAAEAQQALRGLAHATHALKDSRQIYDLLGSLSMAASSLQQVLHQLGSLHDRPNGRRPIVDGDARAGRAAAYQVAWELHRAGEMMRQVAATLDHAHEVEGKIAYDLREAPGIEVAHRQPVGRSIEL